MGEDLSDKSCGGWMNGLCIGGLELSRGKTDDRRQETSQLVGTTCRTRDFAAGLSDAAVFLISTLHVTGFHGRYLRARPVSSEGSQKPAYRIRTIRRGILITQRLPSDLVASAALRHTVVAKRVSLIRDTNLQVNVANSTVTDEDWLVKPICNTNVPHTLGI
jgi:hypothetical protein